MSTSLRDLIPELQDAAQQLLNVGIQAGVFPQVTSTLRSPTEQARLYRRYLAGASRYPVAPPGSSAHEYGWAFDLVVAGEQNQADMGEVWRSWGGVWHPSDAIHFEYPGFRAPAPEAVKRAEAAPSLWDYAGWALSATSLVGLLLELGYVAASREEAEKIARALHIDPHGHVF